MSDQNGTLLLTLFVAFGLTFLLRELFTWYWKLNEIVKLLKEQNELLRKQLPAQPQPIKEETP